MVITIVSPIDCADSGKRLSEAIKRHSSHKVIYLGGKMPRHVYADGIKRADIIWVKGDFLASIGDGTFSIYDMRGKGLIRNISRLPIKQTVKLVFSPGGSGFRRKNTDYKKSYASLPLSRYIKEYDYIAPLTPDLNYPQLKGTWLPHAWDVDNTKYVWKNSPIIKIGAYYGQGDSKNAVKYLVPAVERLKAEGKLIEIVSPSLEKKGMVPQNVFLDTMKTCTIYFEEITPIGVYGNSGVQAMAMGIPIIANISSLAKSQANPHTNYGAPCLNACDEETLYELLRDICDKAVDLQDISQKTKQYASDIHGYQSIAKQVNDIITLTKRRS